MNAMWRKVDNELPAVDDIETISLHLSENTQKLENQEWSLSRNVPVIELDDYSFKNSKARERRRIKLDAENKHQTRHVLSNVDRGDAEECIYTGFYESHCLAPKKNLTLNHQTNCFTILNKHYAMNSDSSSGNCDDVEEIPRYDTDWYDRTSNDDITIERTDDPEKRTIWIYSFKNKPNLRNETEYELIDIPNDSMSDSSMELGEEAAIYEDTTATSRVATPIPASYVPRLDLTKGSTLPTVTEITETKSDDEKTSKVFVPKKPKNSWFSSDTTPSGITTQSDHKAEKPSDFRWAPSSARERRRRVLYGDSQSDHKEQKVRTVETSTESFSENILESKRSVSSQTRAVEIIPLIEDDTKLHSTPKNATSTNFADNIVEIHKGHEGIEIMNSPLQKTESVEILREGSSPQKYTGDKEQDQTPTRHSTPSIHLYTDDVDVTTPIPIGRYKRLRINVSPNAKPIVPSPIENPDSTDWIEEKKKEFSNSYDNIHLQIDNAGSRLLVRNELLLKPSRWDDYAPVTGSLQSLHITIDDSDSEDDSWWRRVINCLLCRQT